MKTEGFSKASSFTKNLSGFGKTTGDQQLVKRINRSVLLRLLRAQPGLSRARLAQHSGLTKSTVSALVRELLAERWLVEASAPMAQDGMGRPSTPLRIDGAARVLLGVEIGVQQVRLVLVSLAGQVIHTAQEALAGRQVVPVCRQAARMLLQAWLELRERGLLLSGVGVCLPGAIDERSGVVRFAPNLGWRDVPFLELLKQALADVGMPEAEVLLHNDADAAALGEYEFAGGDDMDRLIFVDCDVGVGAGIVLNDRLFTGARGTAGEIGHSVMQVDGMLCSCGRRGCAETFIGARALGTEPGVKRAAHYLGVLIQNLDVLFNPHLVVVGGQSCSSFPGLIDGAARTVQAYAESAGVPAPAIRGARYGLLAAAVGAAAVSLHRQLRPMHGDAAQTRHRGNLTAPEPVLPDADCVASDAAATQADNGALCADMEPT